ncbi:HlyD family efflux transporter periplasmic adaptor subunit [Altererythrobacter sp. ZODW24]|uniref:efflux RND transporter periplasmic adaptor subunit n=1 Tax=Altererythrobacter sp. ZODW24 TaxID=2185142 RepID=UPI000DF75777|nr:HlyD family efflux transporter periplasmic adaptor subunit [Altererythrobacter sp. ZODW24]
MTRQALWAVGLIGGAIVLAALMIMLRPEPVEQERVEQAPLVETASFAAAAGPLQVQGSGTVQPREEVTIGAEVGGRLTYVNGNFREGSTVGAGTTLFRIDTSDFRNRVRTARADVAAQDVAVLQAQQEVTIAEAELERFAQREARGSALATVVDPDDYASRILPPAGMATEDVKPRASSQPSQLATREPQLRSARAARERAAANLADARLSLSRTSVSAPFSGIVRSETAAVGTLVQAGQALGSIVSTASYEVRVSLTESEAALIPGLLRSNGSRIPASVYSDFGGLTYRWDAFVDRADGILDPETRTIDVFLRVPNPLGGGRLVTGGEDAAEASRAPPLLLGSFVRAEITGASLASYAAISADALRSGNTIWVVRDGKLRILPVRVIQRTDDTAYISTPSLAQGGRLVISSLRTPTDGMPVRMNQVNPAKPAAKKPAANE